MNEAEFRNRTKQLALRTIKLVDSLPKSSTGAVLGKRVLRSATSVGANYRVVCRAKSPADIVNKLRIVEEEADESGYWLDLNGESGLTPMERLSELIKEFDGITAMVVASQKTIRTNNPKSKIADRKSDANPKSKIGNPK